MSKIIRVGGIVMVMCAKILVSILHAHRVKVIVPRVNRKLIVSMLDQTVGGMVTLSLVFPRLIV